jgi:hypothetical protein
LTSAGSQALPAAALREMRRTSWTSRAKSRFRRAPVLCQGLRWHRSDKSGLRRHGPERLPSATTGSMTSSASRIATRLPVESATAQTPRTSGANPCATVLALALPAATDEQGLPWRRPENRIECARITRNAVLPRTTAEVSRGRRRGLEVRSYETFWLSTAPA